MMLVLMKIKDDGDGDDDHDVFYIINKPISTKEGAIRGKNTLLDLNEVVYSRI